MRIWFRRIGFFAAALALIFVPLALIGEIFPESFVGALCLGWLCGDGESAIND